MTEAKESTEDKKRRVIYVSSLVSAKMENRLFEREPQSVSQPIQKFHRLFVKGLHTNGIDVSVLSYHVGTEQLNCNNGVYSESEEGVPYSLINTENSRFSYLSVFLKAFLLTKKFLKKNASAVLICDVLNLSVSLGAVLAARLCGSQAVGVITDHPDCLFRKGSMGGRISWLVVSFCTGYIVLTKQMAELMKSGKKILVLEGLVDSGMKLKENRIEEKRSPRICLYAGALHQKYGIEKLIQAFQKAEVQNAELHLYGTGDYLPDIQKLRDPKIRYCGIITNQEMIEQEARATLLVNPRPTSELFTLYSFPSKNLEYMISGTPLLTTELPGMPEEHKKYVYLFKDESIDGMAETLRQVLDLSDEELNNMGHAARKYMLGEKTETVQAKKVMDMIWR